MVSRERLLHLARSAERLTTARRARLVGRSLLVAALVFVLVRLRSVWHDSRIDLARVDWGSLAGAVAVAAVGVLSGGFIWLAILRKLGARTERRWANLFFQAQLGKYIPGTVWQYASRTMLARTHELPVRAVALSLPLELGASALAAAAFSALLLGWWGTLVLAVIVGGVLLAKRLLQSRGRRPAAFAAGIWAWLLYLLVAWPLLGLSFWLCANALVTVSPADLPTYAGAYAVAWLAGLVAIYAPGGLGVREAVLVALLAGTIGATDALVIAAASRLMLTVIDLGLAGIGTALLSRPAVKTESRTAAATIDRSTSSAR